MTPTASRVATLRRFNRFYTGLIGALDAQHLRTPFTLPEARVIYEIAHAPGLSPTALTAALRLDAGYVSRLLRTLERRGVVARAPHATDRRQVALRLTAAGRSAFRALDAGANRGMAALLAPLSEPVQRELTGALARAGRLLGADGATDCAVVLRPPAPGELGWVIERHGAIYAAEYGWNTEFEGLVADICARFVRTYKPSRERCWIAERDGVPVGSVFVVEKSRRVAQLRLLLVEPSARGLGIGARLVEECIRFARRTGYHKMMLWTQSVLGSARRIYQQAGFTLAWEHPHRAFGVRLVEQVWELDLRE
ncbi:MAG: bifunctional helix-turn-helix transcriptional regulator/GNAT family N-acetyltransferase [Gemmatimonadaceae bacterium]